MDQCEKCEIIYVYVVEPMKPFPSPYSQNYSNNRDKLCDSIPLPVRRIVCVFLCSKKQKKDRLRIPLNEKKRENEREKKETMEKGIRPSLESCQCSFVK